MSGLELGPHSTSGRGVGLRASDPYALDFIWLYAPIHGVAPANTLERMKSSWARSSSTPGCAKTAGACAPIVGLSVGPADGLALTDGLGEALGEPVGAPEPSR